jgi:signal transduction histidine kinase
MGCHRLFGLLGPFDALLARYRQLGDGDPRFQKANDRFERILKQVKEAMRRTQEHLRRPVLRLQRTDLFALVRKTFDQHPYPGRYHLDPDLNGFEIDVDPTFLGLALEELIENASKHHPDPANGLITIRVEGCQVEGCEWARITFGDNGPGVPETIRPRVFEPFFSHRVHNESGIGMGLFHVQRIIAAHGGSIRLEGSEGGGAAFVIELPGH